MSRKVKNLSKKMPCISAENLLAEVLEISYFLFVKERNVQFGGSAIVNLRFVSIGNYGNLSFTVGKAPDSVFTESCKHSATD